MAYTSFIATTGRELISGLVPQVDRLAVLHDDLKKIKFPPGGPSQPSHILIFLARVAEAPIALSGAVGPEPLIIASDVLSPTSLQAYGCPSSPICWWRAS